MQMKVCTKCLETKPLDQFRKSYTGMDKFGVRPICIECQRIYDREYARQRRAKAKNV